jgi:hypothetical protein
MKSIPALVVVAAALVGPAKATEVGVTIEITRPGVHGRVDIGRHPQPMVIVPQPVIIQQPVARPQPVYMWVPHEHRKNWRKYCRDYGACGVPVYFVRHDWYDRHVRHGRGRDRDDDDDDRRDRRERDSYRHRGGEFKQTYYDGPCKIERERKRDGSYKEERECKASRGERYGRRGQEFEQKYRDGPCEVEREWKRDGTYKEKVDCKA